MPDMPLSYTTRTTCRVCGSTDLTPLFSLGDQFVSDFVDKDKISSGPRCPIDLELCQRCTLVQLKHTAPQELLYSRHYWYHSGVTSTMRAALLNVARTATLVADLKDDDVVLDIGSNDSTLLRSYAPGIVKIGVEPADNLIAVGRVGIDYVIHDFWGGPTAYAEYVRRVVKKAKAITACGMFYDCENPNDFIADVARALDPKGVFIAQLMCLQNMLNIGDVGNFAHEHLEFYSLRSLEYLFGQHGLVMYDLETNDVNGESYRIYIRHGPFAGARGDWSERLREAYYAESNLDDVAVYKDFFQKMEQNKKACVDFIRKVVANNKTVAVYGASTKGNVILQYYGLDNTLITYAADRSPEKVGKYTVGTGIPIVSNEAARVLNPDYFLILPYAFLPEFIELEKDQAWRRAGGKFLVPLPEFKIV